MGNLCDVKGGLAYFYLNGRDVFCFSLLRCFLSEFYVTHLWDDGRIEVLGNWITV